MSSLLYGHFKLAQNVSCFFAIAGLGAPVGSRRLPRAPIMEAPTGYRGILSRFPWEPAASRGKSFVVPQVSKSNPTVSRAFPHHSTSPMGITAVFPMDLHTGARGNSRWRPQS